ncbi:MAG: hypothetical protein JNJ71_04215 [Rubrivivax sp.]|nr:hypothetical protein [Rubrivivax sp.]
MTALPARLHDRLQALAASLAARPDALGLLGLGSVGCETERADAWSDLDFFVLVRPGSKPGYLSSLDWLAAAHPLAWAFANTVDGCKALMSDGLFCEFAVFEPQELAGIPYAPGRWLWRREAEVEAAWATPARPLPAPHSVEWRVGEALSNLLVGLQRWQRGERVAAMRMVQVFALDRLLELIDEAQAGTPGVTRDAFSAERRFEARHPGQAVHLARWAPGLSGTPEAALAMLDALAALGPLPQPVVQQIVSLARR